MNDQFFPFKDFMEKMQYQLKLPDVSLAGDTGAIIKNRLDDGSTVLAFVEVLGRVDQGTLLLISSQATALPEEPAGKYAAMESALVRNVKSYGSQWAVRDLDGLSLVAVTHLIMEETMARDFQKALSLILGEFIYGRKEIDMPGCEPF